MAPRAGAGAGDSVARYNADMTLRAGRVETLAVMACTALAAAAVVLAPASAEASRYLPAALERVIAPQASPESLAGAADHHPALRALTTADRVDLADLAAGARLEGQQLRLLGAAPAVEYDATVSCTTRTHDSRRTIENRSILAYDDSQGQPSARLRLFHGAWTDPVTGIAYARSRWLDSRTASWLAPDGLGGIDSPNLYAPMALQPHMLVDPLGLSVGDWAADLAGDVASGMPGELGGQLHGMLDLAVGGELTAARVREEAYQASAGLGMREDERRALAAFEGARAALAVRSLGFSAADDPLEHGATLLKTFTGIADIQEGLQEFSEGRSTEGPLRMAAGVGGLVSLAYVPGKAATTAPNLMRVNLLGARATRVTAGARAARLAGLAVPERGAGLEWPTHVRYGEGLSAYAKSAREAATIDLSRRNFAVIHYIEDGTSKIKVVKNVPGGLHAEEVAEKWLHRRGIGSRQVREVYSEYFPCANPRHDCRGLLKERFPDARVSFTWPYGTGRRGDYWTDAGRRNRARDLTRSGLR